MQIDERSRHQLFLRLEQLLGREEAGTLMAHLPLTGWANVATKRDLDVGLDQLERRIDLKLEATKQELMANVRGEFVHLNRTVMFAVIGAVASVGGLVVAAVRLG